MTKLVSKGGESTTREHKDEAEGGQDLGGQFHQGRALQEGLIIAGWAMNYAIAPDTGIHTGPQLGAFKLTVLCEIGLN